MAAVTSAGGGGIVLEIINDVDQTEEISPLLSESGPEQPAPASAPRLTIFSVSYSGKRRPHKELSKSSDDLDISSLSDILSWAWSGSRYSGLLCMVFSSTIYFIMEVVTDIFPARPIPIFQTIFTRCMILLLLSLMWLRRNGYSIVLPTQVRSLMAIRSMAGFLSLICFIYSLRYLPQSNAVALIFATPIIASFGARIILQERIALPDALGLACSCLGLLFIHQPTITLRGNTIGAQASDTREYATNFSVYPLILGILSSLLGGVTLCLIRVGAKKSDQPVYTVFSFGAFASVISTICMITLQEFVLPDFYTAFLMILLGVLSFLAEISLAHGLQLTKISKGTNILFVKVLLSQIWSMLSLRAGPSFFELLGCLLILGSISSTLYMGPEREIE